MSYIRQLALEEFLEQLASRAPTPGGGSAAALMGAQSAALLSMVCNLTIGKVQYSAVQEDMQALLNRSEALRVELTDAIEADVKVFNAVMAAYRLPRESVQEQTVRNAAVQQALQMATDVPLLCARACAELIQLSRTAAEKGCRNVVSDAGVAVMSAYAALQSATLNVFINIDSIQDRQFTDARKDELEQIMKGASAAAEEIYQQVKSRL